MESVRNKLRSTKFLQDKMDTESSAAQGSKRPFVEDIESSQGASDTPLSKRLRSSAFFNPMIGEKKKKGEAARAAAAANPAVAAKSSPAPPETSDENGELLFSCASCHYECHDEMEFLHHMGTAHQSDLSMWCKNCGKCFGNAGRLVSHIKEKACLREEMIYRCGVNECTFETSSGQTFVHHLCHCHKGSPFISCVHCLKIFALPHCLILHMQNDCHYKERNPAGGPGLRSGRTDPCISW